MQKIAIKNFGPIKDAEVDVKEVLVLIGEQASGKSTIAKLIYFFKSIADDLFDSIYSSENLELDLLFDVKRPIRQKFYEYFGYASIQQEFSITYYYDTLKGRSLTLDNNFSLYPIFSKGFFSDSFRAEISRIKGELVSLTSRIIQNADQREKNVLEQDRNALIRQLSLFVDELFANKHTSRLYAIAGRENTVSYESAFEAYLEQSISNLLDENRKKTTKAKEHTIDETLMLDYLREIRRVKEVFKKYGGDFATVMKAFSYSDSDILFDQILKRIGVVLKGNYTVSTLGERLTFEDDRYVSLKDASSGQKEVIRILQDLVLCILERQTVMRVVEEPEAHLFPIAQKQLVEMLVYMRNMNSSNQLIITTHSPYILTVMNNLLFASRVIAKNESLTHEVSTRIPKEFHIDPSIFAAYSLGQDQDAYCESVFNPETGVIKQNYLDTVSDMLGADFRFLYGLHAKSFKKIDGNA